MEYRLEEHTRKELGSLLLKEQLSDSVVRLQTNDRMLSERSRGTITTTLLSCKEPKLA